MAKNRLAVVFASRHEGASPGPLGRGQKRHRNIGLLGHINHFSVTPATGPPGRVPGQKCLCSLGSAHST